jgi:succinyl-CoA synthetase beta subunit
MVCGCSKSPGICPSLTSPSMDAKFGFDDNADFRQTEVFKLRDISQEDAQEVKAAEVSLQRSYVWL